MFTLNNVQVYDDIGDIGLPWISTTMTINGNGSTIQRNSNAPYFRIMAVGKNGNLTLNNTTIRGGYVITGHSQDYSHYYGGGGILNQGILTISSGTLTENENYDGEYAYGGAIDNVGALTIINSYIINNEADGWDGVGGGGINSDEGSVTILNSVVSGNHAEGDSTFGGGIAIGSSSLLVIDNSIIANNTVEGYDGAIYGGGIISFGSTTISNSTFTGNHVYSTYNPYNEPYGSGGAIVNAWNGVMTISNSTISANIADSHTGGILNYNDMTITNTTITSNNNGGVFTTCEHSDPITRFRRTIVSGNSGGEVTLDYAGNCPGGVVANKHNVFGRNGNAGLIGFSPGATDIVPAGALNTILSPLANNGGPTLTHALPSGSPALDRAPNAACAAAPVNLSLIHILNVSAT